MQHWTQLHCWRSQCYWWTQPLLSNCFKATTLNIASTAQQISIDQQKKQICNMKYLDRSTLHWTTVCIYICLNTQTQTTYPIATPLHFWHWMKPSERFAQSLQKPRRQRTWQRSTRVIESTVNTTLHSHWQLYFTIKMRIEWDVSPTWSKNIPCRPFVMDEHPFHELCWYSPGQGFEYPDEP